MEDYGFEYSDEEQEEQDVDIENQYYNSKGIFNNYYHFHRFLHLWIEFGLFFGFENKVKSYKLDHVCCLLTSSGQNSIIVFCWQLFECSFLR